MSFTIHSKYKYFDSTVQRAENRWQKFHFCRLPFAVNVMLNLSINWYFYLQRVYFVRVFDFCKLICLFLCIYAHYRHSRHTIRDRLLIFTYTLYAEIKKRLPAGFSSPAVAVFFFGLVLFPFSFLAGVNAHLTFYWFSSALKGTFQS